MGVDVAYQCRRLALFAQSRLAAVQQHETSCGRRRKVWGCVEVVAGEERGLRNGGGALLAKAPEEASPASCGSEETETFQPKSFVGEPPS